MVVLNLHLVMEALRHLVFLSHLQAMEAPNLPLVMVTHNQPGVTPALLVQAMVATKLTPAMEAHNQLLVMRLHRHLLAMVAHNLLQDMAAIPLLLMEVRSLLKAMVHSLAIVILTPLRAIVVHNHLQVMKALNMETANLLQVSATPLATAILTMALVMAIQAMGGQNLLVMAVQLMEAAQVMELLGDIECMWEICHGQVTIRA